MRALYRKILEALDLSGKTDYNRRRQKIAVFLF